MIVATLTGRFLHLVEVLCKTGFLISCLFASCADPAVQELGELKSSSPGKVADSVEGRQGRWNEFLESCPANQVAVVGATGAVGEEMIEVLHARKFPLSELTLLASERSAGKSMSTPYGEKQVEAFSVERAQSCDFVLMAVSGSFSTEFSPQITANGKTVVIDNSSAFRYHDDIPLVVPEINQSAMDGKLLIANPNCTTAIAAMALWPLHQHFKLKKVIVSTYQAASGAGAQGMTELEEGTRQALEGKVHPNEVFAHPLPFNVIPHIDSFQSNGYTKEEMKVVWETQKIFGDKSISCSCTAVRIPTKRAHSEAITIETEKEVSPEAALEVLKSAPGVQASETG
eukprot:Skav226201  [mRNA]  locus=scaffold2208:358929:379582:- [translate_table: standard]